MAYDQLLLLAASAAVTASTNHPSLNLRNGTPTRGMVARIVVTAVSGTTPTAIFKIQHSNDNAAWDDLALCQEGTVTVAGEYSIRFATQRPYIRLVSTIAGTTPSFTYSADLGTAFP